MTWFSADPDGSDAPFTGIGDPVLVVTDKRRSLVAVAGEREYDGGYFFEGELLLVHLETGTAVSLIDHHLGRQVLGLERLSHQELRVLMAPPDDWKDGKAHVEGHPAVVHRSDWTAVEAKSLTGRDLAGPRGPAPRLDHREDAKRAVARLDAPQTRRHGISGADPEQEVPHLRGGRFERLQPGLSRTESLAPKFSKVPPLGVRHPGEGGDLGDQPRRSVQRSQDLLDVDQHART
ncbi:hypothetical protein OHA00_26565 [Streptomyces cellulosae]|nr:hypothetical protein OHA00_26565 [Streptomyces cellulosae]